MKLNHECVRDLLLYLEDNLSYNKSISINSLTLKSYSQEELIYCAEKLIEANYLICTKADGYQPPLIVARSITYSGHQFLDNIRDNTVWKETQNILSKVTSTSLSFASNIASQVLSNIISKQMGLN
nr:MAG TPA: MarR family transcriptional regulator, transcription factor, TRANSCRIPTION REGULATOR.05A [Caudoviricetes sp.]